VKKRQAEIVKHAGNVIRSFLQEANKGKVVVNMIRLLSSKVCRIQRWWRKRLQAHVRRFAALRNVWMVVERAVIARSMMAEVATRLIAAGERPSCLDLFPAALQTRMLSAGPARMEKGGTQQKRRRTRHSLITEMSSFLSDIQCLLEISRVEPSEMSEVSEESETTTQVSVEGDRSVSASRAALRRGSVRPQDVEGIVLDHVKKLEASPALQFKVLMEKLLSLQEKFSYLRRRYKHQLDQYRSTMEFQLRCKETTRKLRAGNWLQEERREEEKEREEGGSTANNLEVEDGGIEYFNMQAPKFPSFPISTTDIAKISFWIVSTHERVASLQAAEGENSNPFFQSKEDMIREDAWEAKSRKFLVTRGEELFASSEPMMVSSLPKEVPLFSLSKEVRGGREKDLQRGSEERTEEQEK